jgi:hypothetical protein
MNPNILQAHINYQQGKLESVTVLVKISPDDIRAMQAGRKKTAGYLYFEPIVEIGDGLLQLVAELGMELPPDERDRIFPDMLTNKYQ